ncbi:MAG TPA: flagellar biosynthesis protein FlhA [Phycisphaerae bacterium]|nr:flagellar biosynthesis protein FlhA [Phycisphaerae bacterium]
MSAESENPIGATLLDSDHAGFNRLLSHNDIIFAAGLAMVLVTLLIPLPTFVLDVLLSGSVAAALATMIIVLSTREAIDLSTFPSLLLSITLFRLSLNVASTRLILSQGDAGDLINTFGNFVVAGNFVIGLVVFLILVVIQFVVITKGAERISEVAARFNLDAMPGKQMSIDADLNAGLIGEQEARQRRQKIVRESEFYGAMDGASKFIRGDAIAGLIITGINLIGGIIVGMTRGMTAGESVRTYAILAIGDGLVTQIPAVIISSSSGFLISKTSTKRSVTSDLARQLLARSRPLWIASFLLAGMIMVPGFPKLPFIGLSIGTAVLATRLRRYEKEIDAAGAKPAGPATDEVSVEELLAIDKVSIQVGPRLIRIVDPRRNSSVSHRITPLRKRFAQEFGIILPLIRLRDNVALDATTYEIRLDNHVVATGRIDPDRLLAMDPGTAARPVPGIETTEPVFHLPALWINPDVKADAEINGYTVVDPESVLVTHLSETLRKHAHELLSRDDVKDLVDRLRERQPALINGVIGETVPVALLHRVLQTLLKDQIPIRELARIIEVVGDNVERTKDPAVLGEMARKALVRTITDRHKDPAGRVRAITLDPALEHELRGSVAAEGADGLALAPDRAMELARQIAQAWQKAMELGHDKAVLLCDYRIRYHLDNLLARHVPDLPIVGYDEIAAGTDVEPVATISLPAEAPAMAGGPFG